MYFGDMDVKIHVVGEVNYLSNICKPVFLLQSCVQLANLGGVKLFEPRRKKIEFVHVGGAYHFIRQGNMFLRVVGIAANGKILRVVGGNADVPHSFVQLLLCGGHIQPIAAGVARVKAAAVAYHNRKLFAHVFTLLFLPGIFGDSCRLLLLRGFFALYGVVRHEHTVYFEMLGVLLRDRRGDFRKQTVVCFDTSIQILFHSRLIGKNLSVLSGNLRLPVPVRAVGINAPCERIRVRDALLLLPVVTGVLVNVVVHLIYPVAAGISVIFAFLPLVRSVLHNGCPCVFNRFVKQKRFSRLLFPSGGAG